MQRIESDTSDRSSGDIIITLVNFCPLGLFHKICFGMIKMLL